MQVTHVVLVLHSFTLTIPDPETFVLVYRCYSEMKYADR